MSSREALLHLARILGRERLLACLGVGSLEEMLDLTPARLAAVQGLTAARVEEIARALLEEAAACDDVTDSASALAYLEDRLGFLGDLLSEETRERVRTAFSSLTAHWG